MLEQSYEKILKTAYAQYRLKILNREFRDREKVTRGLKKDDSSIINGYQLYHNYIRPHMSLEGKTSADKAGIEIQGQNKWIILIQNAKTNQKTANFDR